METLCPTSVMSNSDWFMQSGHSTTWTTEENKVFESALAIFDENTPNRWYEVASMIPTKTIYDVMNQYQELEADIKNIEEGLVPDPKYLASAFTWELADHHDFDVCRKRGRAYDHERKKGVPWTEEEHRRFLLGLEKHGKGDWRNISRNFVKTKTPTQVASHAQKYYLRQLSGGKDKRRPSIHDITTVNLADANSRTISGETMASIQKPTNAPKILLDWTRNNNDGPYMVFDSGCVDIARNSHYVFNLGDFGI